MAGVASVAAAEAAGAAEASDAPSQFTAADEIAHLRRGHKFRPKIRLSLCGKSLTVSFVFERFKAGN